MYFCYYLNQSPASLRYFQMLLASPSSQTSLHVKSLALPQYLSEVVHRAWQCSCCFMFTLDLIMSVLPPPPHHHHVWMPVVHCCIEELSPHQQSTFGTESNIWHCVNFNFMEEVCPTPSSITLPPGRMVSGLVCSALASSAMLGPVHAWMGDHHRLAAWFSPPTYPRTET